jgi:hypothetical protein
MHDVLDLDLSYRPTVRLYVRAVVRSIHVPGSYVRSCGAMRARERRAARAHRASSQPAAAAAAQRCVCQHRRVSSPPITLSAPFRRPRCNDGTLQLFRCVGSYELDVLSWSCYTRAAVTGLA